MSLLWVEGFESFGTTTAATATGISSKYLQVVAESNYTVRPGRVSGQACRIGTGGSILGFPYLGTISTVIVGFGFLQDAFTAEAAIVGFVDDFGGQFRQIEIDIETTGKLKVYRGVNQVNLLGTTSTALTASTWTYVEIKITFHPTAGTVDIWFNGSNVLSLTGQNTRQSSNNQMTHFELIGSSFSADHTTFDDLYVCDTNGSINNSRGRAAGREDHVPRFLMPGQIQFTTNSGTNHYDRVNSSPHDADNDLPP